MKGTHNVSPTKRKDNNLYADVYKVFEKSADELETLFTAIKENKLTPEEFKEIYFGKVNNEYNSLKKSISKTLCVYCRNPGR